MLLSLAILAGILALPASAGAATYVLRPNVDISGSGGWTIVPTGMPGWAVLNDPITEPTVPTTTDDYASTTSGGTQTGEVGFSDMPLNGERVLSISLWTYTQPGSERSLKLELTSGLTSLASITVPKNAPAAWREVQYVVPAGTAFTQAELDDLRWRLTTSGNRSTTPVILYAGYAHVATDLPPDPPTITSSPGALGNDATPTWSFTTAAGTGAECRVESGGAMVIDWAACTGTYSPDLSLRADALYTFLVRAKDGAGVTSAPATSDYTLDRAGPAAPVFVTTPTSPSAEESPTWDFTYEPGAPIVECRVRSGGLDVVGWAPCSTPAGFDMSAQPDGTYDFETRVTDAAGNIGATATSVFVLDRTVPAPPDVTVTPAAFAGDPSPSWSFSADGAGSYECRLEADGTLVYDYTACASPHQELAPLSADGTYRLLVRGVGPGGTGPETAADYVFDTTAPAPPIIDTPPPSPSADPQPELTFSTSGEPGSTFDCRVESGGAGLTAWTACTSPATYDLTSLGSGSYDLAVRVVDRAGNPGAASTAAYVLDTTAPGTPAIDDGPGPVGNGRSPAWQFSSTTSSAFECRLVDAGGNPVGLDWTSCTTPRGFDLTGQLDGTYTFEVRGVSPTFVTGPAATAVYELDTSAPAAPSLSLPASPSADDRPSFGFTGEPGATFECALLSGGVEIAEYGPCTSPDAFDLSAAPDGTYDFEVRATDLAGNTGPEAIGSYVLDRSVPAAPSITAEPAATGNGRSPSWTFSGSAARYECRFERDGTMMAGLDWQACTAATPVPLDLTGEPDATYTFRVRGYSITDVQGAETSRTYVLDTAVPAAPSITGGPATLSADDTPAWSFTGELQATFRCRLDGGAWTSCTSPESRDLTAPGADGPHTFEVEQTDEAGNTGPAAASSYTLDRSQPPAPALTPAQGPRGTSRSPSWSFSGAGAGQTYECSFGGSPYAACTSPRAEDLTSATDGVRTFAVRIVSATNVRGPAATSAYELDTTGPAAPAFTATPGATGSADRPAWSFTAEAGATTECRVELGGGVVDDWAPCASPRTVDLSTRPDGLWTLKVRATDALGTTGAVAASDYRLDRSAPVPPTIDGGPGALGATRTPGWSFSGEGSAAFECRLERDGAVLLDWASCASPRPYDLTGSADGTYTFIVRSFDAAGNRSASAASAYTLDTTPGAVRIDSGPGLLGRDRRPAWAFSGDAAAGFSCRLSLAGQDVAPLAACVSPFGFDLAGRPDGAYRFAVRSFDAAGNASGDATADYELDTTAPAAPDVTSAPSSPGTDRSPTWRFTAEAKARIECRLERRTIAIEDWAPCTSPYTADLSKAPVDVATRFMVRAIDRAGNTGATASRSYTLEAQQTKSDPEPQPKSDDPAPPAGSGAGTPAPPADPPSSSEPAPAAEEGHDASVAGDAPATPPARPRSASPGFRLPHEAGGLPRSPRQRRAAPAASAKRPERTPEPVAPRRHRTGITGALNDVAGAVYDGVRTATSVVVDHPDKSVFPMSLLFIVLGFLGVQSRIDRSDPKLALAPVHADPDLDFT